MSSTVAGTLVVTADGAVPIEQIEVGQRVLTLTEDSGTEVEPDSWRMIEARLDGSESPGDEVQLCLLRPVDWILEAQAFPGCKVDFELPEMGVRGPAIIEAISPCPRIEKGPGRVVLSTIMSRSGELLEIVLPEGRKLALTAGHHLFSEEASNWTRAGDLGAGDHLKTLTGNVEVEDVYALPGAEFVYNLEVETDHTYLVGGHAVLSHNESCAGAGDKDYDGAGDSDFKKTKSKKDYDEQEDGQQYEEITEAQATNPAAINSKAKSKQDDKGEIRDEADAYMQERRRKGKCD